jgi:hypothetical protein
LEAAKEKKFKVIVSDGRAQFSGKSWVVFTRDNLSVLENRRNATLMFHILKGDPYERSV